jgi:hypothetical protein
MLVTIEHAYTCATLQICADAMCGPVLGRNFISVTDRELPVATPTCCTALASACLPGVHSSTTSLAVPVAALGPLARGHRAGQVVGRLPVGG